MPSSGNIIVHEATDTKDSAGSRGHRWGSAKAERGSPIEPPLFLSLLRGAARRGHGKVDGGHRWGSAKAERGHRWSAGKRSAGSHFYPYRTRVGSHNLVLATLSTEYAMHMLSIC
jgi:hypothetical protein